MQRQLRRRTWISSIVAVGFLSLCLGSSHCRWREGRSVWIRVYDASPDADGDAPVDGSDGGCLADQGASIAPEELLGLVFSGLEEMTIIDVRAMDLCVASRIPGALCNPLVDGEMSSEIEVSDEQGWLVLYDAAGDLDEETLAILPVFCRRHVVFLEGGFGAWAVHGDYPLEEG